MIFNSGNPNILSTHDRFAVCFYNTLTTLYQKPILTSLDFNTAISQVVTNSKDHLFTRMILRDFWGDKLPTRINKNEEIALLGLCKKIIEVPNELSSLDFKFEAYLLYKAAQNSGVTRVVMHSADPRKIPFPVDIACATQKNPDCHFVLANGKTVARDHKLGSQAIDVHWMGVMCITPIITLKQNS